MRKKDGRIRQKESDSTTNHCSPRWTGKVHYEKNFSKFIENSQCLLECFVNETSLAVKGNVTTDTVQKSLYSLLNVTTTRMWKPLIDKYVPKCVVDYQNFKKDKAVEYEKMNAGQKQGGQANALEGNCCPSSGYLVSRLMAEFFIVSPYVLTKISSGPWATKRLDRVPG